MQQQQKIAEFISADTKSVASSVSADMKSIAQFISSEELIGCLEFDKTSTPTKRKKKIQINDCIFGDISTMKAHKFTVAIHKKAHEMNVSKSYPQKGS